MLSEQKQLFGKIQTVENVAETLAAADGRTRVFDPKIKFDPVRLEPAPSPYSLSRRAKRTASVVGTSTFGIDLAGSGVLGTAPQWVKYLRCCGVKESDLHALTIGAITGGPFQHGETITGGTSNATGRVVIKTTTGTTTLLFVVLTGTFQSGEVITGSLSAATATTGSVPADAGLEYRLTSIEADQPMITLGVPQNINATTAFRKLIQGARGNVAFDFKAGQPCRMNFTFQGIKDAVADVSVISGISWEAVKAPVFASANLLLGGYAAKIGELSLDLNNKLSKDEDANGVGGINCFSIGGRTPGGSMNPRMVPVATADFYNDWFSDIEKDLDFTIGSVAGNRFRFYMPNLQHDSIEDGDRDGVLLASISFTLNEALETGNDELTILAQ